jgi:hypothetical protein
MVSISLPHSSLRSLPLPLSLSPLLIFITLIRYPNSFIAGYLRIALQQGKALADIIEVEVKERDTYVFPFVEKVL